jgi:hypothetical protein
MAPITVYDVTITLWLNGMKALKAILEKASTHADAATFAAARITPDMLPLSFQVQACSNNIKKGVWRLTGREIEAWADEEKTMEELVARVDKTIALLATVEPKDLEGVEDKEVELQLGPRSMSLDGRTYSLYFFHLTTAYDILRGQGVDLGKRDYLGPFMADYVKE